MKIADRLYIGLIKDLHHMSEIDYIDTASPVARIVIFIDDMWQPDGTQNVAADGDLTFSAFGLSLSE